ncbi:MAG: DUF4302 domain-containing protein [Chitinophagaceae bacterium]|nr:DUF4302 domain-containing protein [Chitinophagaceae bacterium]
MKKILSYILILTVALAGCDKETDMVFEQTPDERIAETLENYQTALAQAPGWKLFVYPSGLRSQDIEVGGLTYYVKFTDANRVTMVSDFTLDMALTPKESSYRLKAVQRPSLIFDTYSYIHVAADPDPDVSSSPANQPGLGWGTDFDFAFTETTPKDTIKLKGNFNGSDAFLIKTTKAEIDAAFAGALANILTITSTYANTKPFIVLPGAGNVKINVAFDLFLYVLTFSYLDATGNIITINAPFSHTTTGLHLKEPVSVGGFTFQDIFWDSTNQYYYIMQGTTKVQITTPATPAFSISLNSVIGAAFKTITVPTTRLPNQSADFVTKYNASKTAIKNGPYNLDLDDMEFLFDAQGRTMDLNVIVFQGNSGFLAQYSYTYTITGGLFKFNLVTQNGNAGLIATDMAPLLNHINNNTFQLSAIATSVGVLGQFNSQQTPAFFFTGNLK